MDKVRLGIIGIGNMGSGHAINIVEGNVPGMEVTAVADIKPARIEWAEKALPESVQRFCTADEMLAKADIDAVLVAVPHYYHAEYSIAAMERGLHVLCEKPSDVYTKQARLMNEAADKSGVVFGMMFQHRTNPLFKKLHDLVQGGTLGAIKRTNWIITDWYRPQAYYDSGDWRATWSGEGGGVLLNQCPHNLDLWQWICGMPEKVYAHMGFGKWRNIEVEDDVTAFVTYPNGATGVFVTCTSDAPGTNRFEITLEKGKLLVENDELWLWELDEKEPDFSAKNTEPFGHQEPKGQLIKIDGEHGNHAGIMRAFADAILKGSPLVVDGREGIKSLEITNALHLSAWLGKEITLPIDEDLFYKELQKRVTTSRRKEGLRETFVEITVGTYGH